MTRKRESTKILKYAKKLRAIKLLGGKCNKCDESNFFKLCFHHVDREEKEYKISQNLDKSWKDIECEILKCDLLCLNCHYELHDKEIKTLSDKVKNKMIYLEFKGLSGCEKCEYDKSLSALHFHHIENKEFEFRLKKSYVSSVKNIKKEIEDELNKCQVLCSNCHNLEHSDYNFFEKNKKLIEEKSENMRKKSKKINRVLVEKMYWNENKKQKEIVEYFDCSKSTISEIIKGIKMNDKSKKK